MKADEMLKIFKHENVLIDVVEDNRFEEPHDQYENFHILECRDGVWSLIMKIQERVRAEEIEKIFKNKDEAIRYFCFYKLQNHYFDTYLREIIYNNKIGTGVFTLRDLLELFNKLRIDGNLYSFNSYKSNAIILITEQNGKYSIAFLDEQKNVIRKTIEFELPEALFFMFEMVYLMHIMKTHLAEMQKKGLLKDGVSNEDYLVLLE
jgi:hypothetical protein